jgi:hypothetical protein
MKTSFKNLRWDHWFGCLLCVFALAAISSCKKSPTAPTPSTKSLVGIYVGLGQLDGGTTNVLIEFTQDSLARWIGGIRYRGAMTYFESIILDSTQDTARFTYHRSDTHYQAWALVASGGLTVHFIAPTGVPEFAVNREQDGANMSGAWSGWMYSQLVGTTHTAVMTMEERDQLFTGSLTTIIWETAQFQFNSGVTNAPSFQISGTTHIGTSTTPCLFFGSYVTADSVAGNWQLGQNGDVDQGTFALGRYFN